MKSSTAESPPAAAAFDFAQGIEIDTETLRGLRDAGAELQLLDVREDWELAVCALPGTIDIPMTSLASQVDRISSATPLVVICHHGGRSLQVAMWLRQQGFADVVSLEGGIDAWAQRVDRSLPLY
jgi:rhodanese-related sulfurtransferase